MKIGTLPMDDPEKLQEPPAPVVVTNKKATISRCKGGRCLKTSLFFNAILLLLFLAALAIAIIAYVKYRELEEEMHRMHNKWGIRHEAWKDFSRCAKICRKTYALYEEDKGPSKYEYSSDDERDD